MTQANRRPRVRETGLIIGEMPTGLHNAITDVAGVHVGHTTLIQGNGPLQPGLGPVRTGVTVILPHTGNLFQSKVCAAVQTINGYGKALGFEQVRELGVIESPVALTNTLNIGLVADALVQHAIAAKSRHRHYDEQRQCRSGRNQRWLSERSTRTACPSGACLCGD